MKYKVMIVEDQTMPRELFELRIQASERFEVALSIDNAALADVYCLRFPVDLILMDVVTRGGESGLDAAERIKRTFPQMKIIFVTSMPECSYLSRAREIGVESFWHDGGRIRLSGRNAGAAIRACQQLSIHQPRAGGAARDDRRRHQSGDCRTTAHVRGNRQDAHPQHAGKDRLQESYRAGRAGAGNRTGDPEPEKLNIRVKELPAGGFFVSEKKNSHLVDVQHFHFCYS